MRILHVIPSLSRGGAERVLVALANEQRRRGHEVTIAGVWSGGGSGLLEELDPHIAIRMAREEPRRRALALPGAALDSWRLRHLIAGQDVVHGHLTYGAVFATLYQLCFQKRRPTPVVVETYHAVGGNFPKSLRTAHAAMLAMRDDFVLMALDPYWERFMRGRERTGHVIRNGVNTHDYEAVRLWRTEVGVESWSGNPVSVGTLGRLAPDRSPEFYVPLFRDVARGVSCRFVIAGEGPLRQVIERQAREQAIDSQTSFLGLVEDPRAVLADLSVFVTIAVGDVVGLAGLEAVACGVPVVALQMQKDYDSSMAWFPSSSAVSDLAEVIQALVRDPERRQSLADSQLRHVETELSTRQMADKYMHVYEETLRRRRT